MDGRALVVGLIIGLVLGAGVASGVWALTADSPGDSEVSAVCGFVERTPVPNLDTSLEDLRRWGGMNELMVSVARDDPAQRPLADALEKTAEAIQNLNFDQVREHVDKAKEHCANV